MSALNDQQTSRDLLSEHMTACDDAYQVMIEENRILKNAPGQPDDDFLNKKRAALERLDAALASIRKMRENQRTPSPADRAVIEKTQRIVLKALLLDRENEQLLRKNTAPTRPEAPRVRPTLDRIQRMYRKHGIAQESPLEDLA